MLPDTSKIVIIGGGIIGCSTAYHLAQLGETDFVVLDQGRLTSGATWHAAGLVGQLRSSANITQLLKYSVELYDRLADETGQSTGWKMNGGLRLACRPERVQEIKRQISMARSFGLEMHYLTPGEVKLMYPAIDTSDVVGAAFLPTDGQANPSDLTQAFAIGARSKGGRLIENCRVEKVIADGSGVAGVVTDRGKIKCEVAVNCAGMWSHSLGAQAGVNIPVVPMLHHYIVTGKVDGVVPDLPTIRDPDRLIYFKEEVGGLVFGGYELNPKPADYPDPSQALEFNLLDFDIDHFESLMQSGLERIPAMRDADIKQMICGIESFTPDGNFIMGEAPEVRNYYVASGFNAFGIASAGGVGRTLAQWIHDGRQPFDLWPVDIRRFGKVHHDADRNRQRTVELCSKHYTMAWPHEEHASGRPAKVSPLYSDLKAQGACFGEKLGWERPNWFAGENEQPRDEYSFGRPNWFDKVGQEHTCVRERAGILDQSSFAKFELSGPGALESLQWMCANRIDRRPGSVIYTQMLNDSGGILSDITVTRLDDEKFFVVSGTGYATHDFYHLKRNIPASARAVEIADVTEQFSTITVAGPNSRDVLQSALNCSFSNSDFPFATYKELVVGGRPVRAIRVSFSGELGWELHMPVDCAQSIYRTICDAGEFCELAQVGYRALESLRLEKGFRSLGSDIGPDYTPLEAGLNRFVRLQSDVPFIGQDALIKHNCDGTLRRRLACFTSDDPRSVILGRETIYRDGERVGWITSGGWGFSVCRNIAYGYVRNGEGVSDEFLFSGEYELEIEDHRVSFQVESQVLYDAQATRMRS